MTGKARTANPRPVKPKRLRKTLKPGQRGATLARRKTRPPQLSPEVMTLGDLAERWQLGHDINQVKKTIRRRSVPHYIVGPVRRRMDWVNIRFKLSLIEKWEDDEQIFYQTVPERKVNEIKAVREKQKAAAQGTPQRKHKHLPPSWD
jgi:hypothetical protein